MRSGCARVCLLAGRSVGRSMVCPEPNYVCPSHSLPSLYLSICPNLFILEGFWGRSGYLRGFRVYGKGPHHRSKLGCGRWKVKHLRLELDRDKNGDRSASKSTAALGRGLVDLRVTLSEA